uniref:TF-B3 domain-containing protein n=1 Tax=Salix viminalis TaxID=40686 RepID=A0A6N2N0D0_SALVM
MEIELQATLWAFQMVQGQNAIYFNARDPTGKVWVFTLCTRYGPHKKPVIRGEWLRYVRDKGLTVDDVIILTMVEDAENGVSYNIQSWSRIWNLAYIALSFHLHILHVIYMEWVFIHLPLFVGLVVYWFTRSLFAILQSSIVV